MAVTRGSKRFGTYQAGRQLTVNYPASSRALNCLSRPRRGGRRRCGELRAVQHCKAGRNTLSTFR